MSLGFFVLTAGEARAEQPSDSQQRQTLLIGGESTQNAAGGNGVGQKPSTNPPPAERPPAEQPHPPVVSTPVPTMPQPGPEPQPNPAPEPSYRGAEPGPQPTYYYYAPTSLPTVPTEQTGAMPKPTAESGPVVSGPYEPAPSAPKGVSDPPVAAGEVSGAPKENGPVPSPAEVIPPVTSQTPPAALPAAPLNPPRPIASQDPVRSGPIVQVPRPQATALASVSDLETTVNSAVYAAFNTIQSTAANVLDSFTTQSSSEPSSPTEEEAPPEGQSIPFAPATPPLGGGNYFSVSMGGGQASTGGGSAPVLVGILVLGLVLVRWDGGRLWRVFCEVTKPSSALLRPLERPG